MASTTPAAQEAEVKTNPYDALSVKHLLDDTTIELISKNYKLP